MHEESSRPIRYRVVVRGGADRALHDGFEHLELDPDEHSLTGTFADSAQLYGLLDRLQDLGISLVSVNPID